MSLVVVLQLKVKMAKPLLNWTKKRSKMMQTSKDQKEIQAKPVNLRTTYGKRKTAMQVKQKTNT